MKRIGDVIRTISIPINTTSGAASAAPVTVRCELCRDAGFVRVDAPVGHPNFGRIFPCQCKVREKEEREAEELRRLSNLDAFAGHTFETFDATTAGLATAYEAARKFARQPEGWLFLHGPCGVGKTHLAAAIANAILERQAKARVVFAVVPDLLDHLRATFDPGSGSAYDDRFNAFRNAHVLVLDDLGTENTTPWAREKLYQIFNHRYNEQLPTVITSNQDLKQIEERVRSRLLDRFLTTFASIDAEDYRAPLLPRQPSPRRW